MSKCLDKTVGDMLYEYELGLLNNEEIDRLEAHLLACEYCRELALEHDQVTGLLRQNREIHELIGELGVGSSEATSPGSKPAVLANRKQRWPGWLRPVAIAAALIAVLILKPWNLQFQPSEEVVASDRILAIMPLENLMDVDDSSKLALITTNLLTTDLSESRFLRVVSNRSIMDMCEAFTPDGAVTEKREDISIRVANAAHATWMLTGSLAELGPGLILTTRVTEVATGKVVLSQTVRTEKKNDVYSLVDQLTAKVRNDLLVPLGDEDVYDPAVADVTTGSATAYRYYLEGLEYYDEVLFEDAWRSWEKALQFDSTFAMCYYYLALNYDQNLIAKAVKYSKRASRREQLHILSLEAQYANDPAQAEKLLREITDQYPEDVLAWTMLAQMSLVKGPNTEAARYLEKALQIDPAHKTAYASLAYLYQDLGDLERALQTAEVYIKLAPNEPNPYDTKADILSRSGALDEAIVYYEKVRSLKPDFGSYTTLLKLGMLYKYKREYLKAKECFQEAATYGDSHARSSARTDMALLPMYQGRLQEAWSVLADGMGADRLDRAKALYHGPGQKNHFVSGLTHLALGEYDEAVKELAVTIEICQATFPGDSVGYRALYAFALTENGDYQAAQVVLALLKRHMTDGVRESDAYWIGSGMVNFARSDYQTALDNLEHVSSYNARASFSYRFWLARALFENHKYQEASVTLSKALTDYASEYRSLMTIWDVQAHFYLAQAYELSEQPDAAIKQYEAFIGIWENADSTLQFMVTDARERLSRLKNTP
jgi:tetratricopeptide (TPR) repeat protein